MRRMEAHVAFPALWKFIALKIGVLFSLCKAPHIPQGIRNMRA